MSDLSGFSTICHIHQKRTPTHGIAIRLQPLQSNLVFEKIFRSVALMEERLVDRSNDLALAKIGRLLE